MCEARRQSIIATTAVALITAVIFAAMLLFSSVSNTANALESHTSDSTTTVTMTPTPTEPTPDSNSIEHCEVIKVAGRNLQFTCYNSLGDIIPSGLITVEPEVVISNITKFVTLPTQTITLPIKTVTIRPPRLTRTVHILGPTRTVTVRNNIPVPVEGPTRTVTRVLGPTGQPSTSYVTVTPSPEVKTITKTETETKTETIVKRILIGTLVSAILAALGMLAMFLGYIMGQKDAEREENNFLQSLRARVRGEAEHHI